MIWHPRPGQRVRVHYAARWRQLLPYHGRTGTVVTAAGPRARPANALVLLDGPDLESVTVPRGNLVAMP